MSDVCSRMDCSDQMRHMRASDLIKIMLDKDSALKFAAEFNEYRTAETSLSIDEVQGYAAAEIDDRAPSLLDRD